MSDLSVIVFFESGISKEWRCESICAVVKPVLNVPMPRRKVETML